MMGLTIRLANEEDLRQIISLLGVLYKGDVGEGLKDLVQEYLESSDHLVLVAIVRDRPVGVLIGSYRMDIDYECRAGFVDALVVAESLRRQGIGNSLVGEFGEWAGKRNCSLLQVINPNRGFFESMGFKERQLHFVQIPLMRLKHNQSLHRT